MKLATLGITKGGKALAARLANHLDGAHYLTGQTIAKTLTANWSDYDGFICVMATGIVVRTIAPLLADKRSDPCVVVLDERGKHVISLLSGHLGGGNEVAKQVAQVTGGQPVITTASDTLGLVALDLWAMAQNLTAEKEDFTQASTMLVNKGRLAVFSDVAIANLPTGLHQTFTHAEADIIISPRKQKNTRPHFYPKRLVVGTGCNRGTPCTEFNEALTELFDDLGLSPLAIRNLASIDKKNDEAGLLAFAKQHQWSIDFFNKDEINQVTNIETSAAALQAVGAIGVAEPTALLSAGSTILLSRKRKWKNITMAVAEAPFTLSAQGQGQ